MSSSKNVRDGFLTISILAAFVFYSVTASLIGAGNMFFSPNSFYYHELAPALLASCWGWVGMLALVYLLWAAHRRQQPSSGQG